MIKKLQFLLITVLMCVIAISASKAHALSDAEKAAKRAKQRRDLWNNEL